MELKQLSALSNSILKLAFPLIITNFAYVALTTIDVVVLGYLGAIELAAGGLAIALFNQLKTTGSGLVTGLSNLVASESVEQDDYVERLYALLTAGVIWAVLCSFFFVGILLSLRTPLEWFGQQDEVIEYTMNYLLIIAPGMLPALLAQVFRHFSTGLKRPGPLLWMTIFSVFVSIFSNYIFVFGHFGIPRFGFTGVPISTVITLIFSLLFFYLMLLKDEKLRPFLKLSKFIIKGWAFKSVFKIGLPIAGTYAAEAGFFTVLSLIIGAMGVEALAAQTVVNQVMYIVFMIPAGFSHSASIHISEDYGKKNWLKASYDAHVSLILALGICFIIGLIYWIMPETIVGWVMSGEDKSSTAFNLAVQGLLFASILQLFDGGQNIGTGVLRGLNDTVTPMKWSMIGYWIIGIPMAWLLGIYLNFYIYGVWVGLGIGLATTAIALFVIFQKRVMSYG